MSSTSTLDAPQRIKDLKSALQTKASEADAILAALATEGPGQYVMSTEQKAAWDRIERESDEIKGLIDKETRLTGWVDTSAEAKAQAMEMEAKGLHADAMEAYRRGGMAAAGEVLGFEGKTFGEQFVTSEVFAEFKAANGRGDSAEFEVKDVYTTLPGTVTNLGFGTTQREPIVERMHRKQRVRDLFGARQTTANLIEYYSVTGLTNNAAAVAERDTTTDPDSFGLKPQSGLTFAPAQDPVRTIAHWEAAHRNVLDDEPQLRGIIDNELLYGLRLAEDAQLMSGSGSGENINGLLNRSVQTYAWSDGEVGDNKADAVRRAITKVILSNYESTGVVLHPNDWEDIELAKDDNARYLITVAVAVGAESRLWRLPVVDTPVIPEGTFLTGAFGLGAQIWDRSAPSIRMAEQHADFFIRNAVIVLCEQRLALTVKRPDAFVKGTFDAAPT